MLIDSDTALTLILDAELGKLKIRRLKENLAMRNRRLTDVPLPLITYPNQ